MNTYATIKFIHVLAAVIALGANLTYPAWLFRGRSDEKYLRFSLEGIRFLDNWIANPSYIVSLLTGLYMCHLIELSVLSIKWVRYALVLYSTMSVLGFAIYTPILRKQIEALADEGIHSDRYVYLDKWQTGIGVMLFLLALAILYLMTAKPI